MAELIEMPFGLRTRVDPGNHVLHGVQISHENGQFWGKGRTKHEFSRIHQVALTCPHGRAHWHLANTIEPSICGSDAVLCQITLTTGCVLLTCFE